jgi:hypothetical protein
MRSWCRGADSVGSLARIQDLSADPLVRFAEFQDPDEADCVCFVPGAGPACASGHFGRFWVRFAHIEARPSPTEPPIRQL